MWVFLSEIGILPVTQQIIIKKVKFYHALKELDDDRRAKKVLEQQEINERKDSWLEGLKQSLQNLGLENTLEAGKTKNERNKTLSSTCIYTKKWKMT